MCAQEAALNQVMSPCHIPQFSLQYGSDSTESSSQHVKLYIESFWKTCPPTLATVRRDRVLLNELLQEESRSNGTAPPGSRIFHVCEVALELLEIT